MAEQYRTIPELTQQQRERFWKRVEVADSGDCWLWRTNSRRNHYGTFFVNGQRYVATRILYLLYFGRDPGDLMVCHTCDNPPCCNPLHLFLGTKGDNAVDMVQKGRQFNNFLVYNRSDENRNRKQGEGNGRAVLTREQVIKIRHRYPIDGRSSAAFAKEYGVCGSTIRNIVRRIIWKHIE